MAFSTSCRAQFVSPSGNGSEEGQLVVAPDDEPHR